MRVCLVFELIFMSLITENKYLRTPNSLNNRTTNIKTQDALSFIDLQEKCWTTRFVDEIDFRVEVQ